MNSQRLTVAFLARMLKWAMKDRYRLQMKIKQLKRELDEERQEL